MTALAAFAAAPHLDGEERDWCRRVLATAWTRHEQSFALLTRVLRVLETKGIRAVALKGPLLAHRHYTPPFLRKSSIDLDLAVRERDLAAACDALAGEGYAMSLPIRDAIAFSHHVVMTHAQKPRVEVHFRLSHGMLGIPTDEFIDRAMPYPLPAGNGTAWILEPADEILHLVLHVACGRFTPLFHLYEVQRLCSLAPPDVLRAAAQRASALHFAGTFTLVDIACRVRLGKPLLPEGIELPPTWLKGRLNADLFYAFERWSSAGELTLGNRLWGRWLDLQTTDRFSDALRLTAHLAQFSWFQLQRRGWRKVVRPSFPPIQAPRAASSEPSTRGQS